MYKHVRKKGENKETRGQRGKLEGEKKKNKEEITRATGFVPFPFLRFITLRSPCNFFFFSTLYTCAHFRRTFDPTWWYSGRDEASSLFIPLYLLRTHVLAGFSSDRIFFFLLLLSHVSKQLFRVCRVCFFFFSPYIHFHIHVQVVQRDRCERCLLTERRTTRCTDTTIYYIYDHSGNIEKKKSL